MLYVAYAYAYGSQDEALRGCYIHCRSANSRASNLPWLALCGRTPKQICIIIFASNVNTYVTTFNSVATVMATFDE